LDEFSELQRCACQVENDKAAREQRLLRLCSLPEGSEGLTFEKFNVARGTAEAYKAALALSEGGEATWLVLQGGWDVGKTHLAIATARRWLARGISARYIVVPELLDELRRAFDPDSSITYDVQFDFYKNVGLLVLDDLGMESSTRWAQEKLDMLIDWRYVRRLPLLVTTNLEFSEMSPRIASRLQRFVPGKVVIIKGPEYRLSKGKVKGVQHDADSD
jgi:DNA replication protein DnaC